MRADDVGAGGAGGGGVSDGSIRGRGKVKMVVGRSVHDQRQELVSVAQALTEQIEEVRPSLKSSDATLKPSDQI